MRVLCLILALWLPTASQSVSLFYGAEYKPLASDQRATIPGDLLTILVMETSNAESATNLASSKSIAAKVSGAYNAQQADITFGLTGSGNSNAKTGRIGNIKAALTARVILASSNGTLTVEGTQRIVINGEEQIITLTGVVRQEDISSQNTVLSTRLSNAKISYSGQGSVSNSEHYNHIYKLLSFLGLV